MPAHEVSLARALGLFDATMIGLGAMIGAGIFVLTGLACGVAGPAAILTFAFNGIVTAFTALSYAELASAIPEAGGGYSYVRRAMPRTVGFLAGWMLWFAYTVACALYARGFAGYALEVLHRYLPAAHEGLVQALGAGLSSALMVLIIVGTFVGLNYIGAKVTGAAENIVTVAKIIVLAIFCYFGIRVIIDDPGHSLAAFVPMFPNGFFAVVVTMGLTFIAFEGYDLIATVSEEIRDPEKNIPRAIFISLSVAVLIYLLIIFVSLGAIRLPDEPAWQFLGRYGETAVVQAAAAFMPGVGVVLIVLGGLLSTSSALNATVLASSRVAFSMGRDGMLPRLFGVIHPKRQTPHMAVLGTGAVLLVLATAFPIETVGSGASLMFLLSFALTNLAAILIRLREPNLKRGFVAPFFPVPQILGVVSCLGLAISQFWIQPMAWAIGAVWVVLGLAGFAIIQRQRLTEGPEKAPLVPARMPPATGSGRVLVPVANPASVGPLYTLARPLAEARDGQVTLLNVQVLPDQTPLTFARFSAAFQIETFQKMVSELADQGHPVSGQVRVAHHLSAGILAAARRPGISLVMLGWRGTSRSKKVALGRTLDRVVRSMPVSVAVVKPRGDLKEIKRILLPTAGGPHARYAALLARDLQEAYGAEVTTMGVVRPEATDVDRGKAMGYIEVTVAESPGLECEQKIVESSDVVEAILVEASQGYDLVMIGAAKFFDLEHFSFGNIPERIGREAPCSVMMVRRA